MVYGLLVTTFAGPAVAGGHYVEVWNPLEARSTAAMPKKAMVSVHKSAKRRHVSLYAAASHRRCKSGAAITARTSV